MIDLSGKKILITGGCGFIASNFIEYIDKNFKNLYIYNIDKWGVGARKDNIIPMLSPFKMVKGGYCETQNGNFYNLSISDIRNIMTCYNIPDKFDYIFHFAAESHVDRSIAEPSSFIENNIIGMVNLLEMIREYQPQAKIINVSTDEVFGHLLNDKESAFTARSPFNPRSPYSASKASSDLIANAYVSTYGLDITTTHCCNNFGKHQADEKFIPTVIRSIINKDPIPVYGSGQNIREWIYVEDHNKWLLEILNNNNFDNYVNIGSGIEKTNLDIIQDIGNIMGVIPNIKFVEDRRGHDFRYAVESYIPFELRDYMEALTETVEFYINKYQKI